MSNNKKEESKTENLPSIEKINYTKSPVNLGYYLYIKDKWVFIPTNICVSLALPSVPRLTNDKPKQG